MMSFEYTVLSYLLNCLWQVPLIFAGAWVASRWSGRTSIGASHKVWVSGMALSVLLPACSINLWLTLQRAVQWALNGGHNAAAGSVSVEVVKASRSGLGITVPDWLRLTILWVYGAFLFYHLLGMVWRALRTSSLSHRLTRITNAAWDDDAADLAVSADVSVPGTIGVFRRHVVLPAGFLEQISEADLSAVLAHELAHVRRHDFLKNILYGAVALPVTWHPCARMMTFRVAESREMICDEWAAGVGGNSRRYAQSILRVASMLSGRLASTQCNLVSIFGNSNLERRIMNLTRTKQPVSLTRRRTIMAACVTLAFTTCTFATAMRVGLAEPAPHGAMADALKKVDVNELSLVEKKNPVYPPAAKKKGEQGTVLIEATISSDGRPENLKIKKGVSKAIDQSARDAVKDWRWKPYLVNGTPVAVETEIRFIFSLAK